MFGVLGPVGKFVVAKRILDRRAEERNRPPQNNNINVVQNNYVNTTAATTLQGNPKQSPSGGLTEKLKGKVSQGISASPGMQETKETVERLQSAAKVGQVAGSVTVIVGAVSYCFGSDWATTELGAGAILCYAGFEGYTILENMKHILDNVMEYKEGGKWKIEEVARQLKKNIYFSDWVVDKIVIPMKFSN